MKASIYGILLACGTVCAAPAAALAEEGYPTRAKVIYGLEEHVFIPELGIRVPAKVDTGAESISLSATNIERFERGEDDDWVRFDLAIDGFEEMTGIEMPLSHNVRIKRRAADYEEGEEKDYSRRPVLEMTVCIGGREAKADVNLANRRGFSTPMLVGAEALVALDALVDPAVTYAMGVPRCPGADKARTGKDDEAETSTSGETATTRGWPPEAPAMTGGPGNTGQAEGSEPRAGQGNEHDNNNDGSASGDVDPDIDPQGGHDDT